MGAWSNTYKLCLDVAFYQVCFYLRITKCNSVSWSTQRKMEKKTAEREREKKR